MTSILAVLLIFVCASSWAQKSCDLDYEYSCGVNGKCVRRSKSGHARCRCPEGFMGDGCAYACQDVYKTCKTRWEAEERCSWARRTTLFFDDNCAATCGVCDALQNFGLEVPFPPLLESLRWLVGKWEATSTSEHRFPVGFWRGTYKETLVFKQADITMFDRPALNVTVRAVSTEDETDAHMEVGFLTSRFSYEETGFEKQGRPTGEDGDVEEIGLTLNSNTGMNSVEVGTMHEGPKIVLKKEWMKGFQGSEWAALDSVERTFSLVSRDQLKETAKTTTHWGETRNWEKYFTRTEEYLYPN